MNDAPRILIVEDNPQNLELMRYLLAAHSYQILTAVDVPSAIEILAREPPDLIISDIQMPKMDGIEFIRWLRDQDPLRHIPVIAVSALAMVGDREKILAAGFDGYMSKPIIPETFARDTCAYLPAGLRMSDPSVAPSLAQNIRPTPTGQPVLLVDNLQSNLDLAEIVLEHLGYASIQAKGMQEALRYLAEIRPALILSDVCMDDGGGFELLQFVKADPELRDIPFLLITSTADNSRDRQKGLALGADRYLTRPIEPHLLREEFEACLAAHKVRT
jgi:two-component system, cell cycle response regulator